MIYLRLYFEFFRVGLFSVGGGMATIPFLVDLAERTGWFTAADLANMLAIAESTPGPIGINMATYVGFTSCGLPGGIISTMGIISPAIIVIFFVSKFLQKFRQSKVVDAVFYGLRAASVALITSSLLQVAEIALLFHDAPAEASFFQMIYWPAVALAVAIFVIMRYTPAKKLHPICFVGLAALVGIVFKL